VIVNFSFVYFIAFWPNGIRHKNFHRGWYEFARKFLWLISLLFAIVNCLIVSVKKILAG
jgi:hypothetical protein